MSNLGMGAMLHMLSGGSPKSAQDYYGRVIKNCCFNKVEDDVRITFEDGITVRIWDSGQSCCERRYMTCDDSLGDLNGKTLAEINVKPGPNAVTEYGDAHEIAFLEIKTTDGTSVSFTTHNEHNGYYGGFGLSIDEVES